MKKLVTGLMVALLCGQVLGQSGGLINGTRGFPQPNDATGTLLNATVAISSSGTAVLATTSNQAVPTYIVVGGAGTIGNATLAAAGTVAPCLMDATLTNAGGFYVINSTTIANECHAQAAAPVAGTWIIGYLHDGATTNGSTALVDVSSFILGGGGGGGGLGDPGANGIVKRTALNATTTALSADVLSLWAGTCNNVSFLRGDGTCSTPPGAGTVTQNGNLATNKLVLGGTNGTSDAKTDTSAGTDAVGNLTAISLASTPTTFASLPACTSGTEGKERAITDSTTNVWGVAIAGSGSNHVDAYCNGTSWVVAATVGSAANAHNIANTLNCPDSSGSGTAQVCTTSPSFTPNGGTGGPNDCVWYTTTTANTTAGLTVNVDALGVKSVAIPGASGWTTTLATSPASIPANKPIEMCYDGTNWDVIQTGVAAAGGSGASWTTLTAATANNTATLNANFNTTQDSALTSTTDAFDFTESAASTGTGALVGLSTLATSTATPLAIKLGTASAGTGITANTPALNITGAFNAGGVTFDAPLFMNITNTASAAGSKIADFQVGGSSKFNVQTSGIVFGPQFQTSSADTIGTPSYGGSGTSTNVFVTGGVGSVSNSGASVAGLWAQGSDNSSGGASSAAGFTIVSGGKLSAAAPAATGLEGAIQIITGGIKGTAIAATFDVVCPSTANFNYTDCSHTGPAVDIAGIAQNTANPISVVFSGMSPVRLQAASTASVGDIVCMGTSVDGQAVDNGTAACGTAGTTLGVVIATSGTITVASAAGTTQNTALSTSIPLVLLHIGK